MKNKGLFIAVIIWLLLMSGCATLDQIVQKPIVRFDSVGIDNLSLVEGTFLFRFNVENPNPVGIRVSEIIYDLRLNDRNFVKSRLDQGLRLRGSGVSPMEIPVTINYLDLFDSVATFTKSDFIKYNLTGSIGVGPFRIPYRTQGKMDVPKLPKISVDKVKINAISFTGASLRFVLGLENQNAFDIGLDGIEYAIKLGDTSLARGTARPDAPLVKNSRTNLGVDMDINILQAGRSFKELISRPSAGCSIIGNMLYNTQRGVKKVPFNFKGNVPLIR